MDDVGRLSISLVIIVTTVYVIILLSLFVISVIIIIILLSFCFFHSFIFFFLQSFNFFFLYFYFSIFLPFFLSGFSSPFCLPFFLVILLVLVVMTVVMQASSSWQRIHQIFQTFQKLGFVCDQTKILLNGQGGLGSCFPLKTIKWDGHKAGNQCSIQLNKTPQHVQRPQDSVGHRMPQASEKIGISLSVKRYRAVDFDSIWPIGNLKTQRTWKTGLNTNNGNIAACRPWGHLFLSLLLTLVNFTTIAFHQNCFAEVSLFRRTLNIYY
jgi:ABC-type multidrug transport system fused ATPase/permease subunit